jgi:RimJ/RimL family protein N-acetyltransferase
VWKDLATVLHGRIVTLEPLADEHRDGLRAAATDEQTGGSWSPATSSAGWTTPSPSTTAATACSSPSARRSIVGSTSYLSLAPEHLRVEIGNTWLQPSAWGTGANVEAKYLLLRHAFETLGCRRVEFKTDAGNERAASRARGASRAVRGRPRKHMLVRGGERRDSAWYAVIDDEWPDVKAALERRLVQLTGR